MQSHIHQRPFGVCRKTTGNESQVEACEACPRPPPPTPHSSRDVPPLTNCYDPFRPRRPSSVVLMSVSEPYPFVKAIAGAHSSRSNITLSPTEAENCIRAKPCDKTCRPTPQHVAFAITFFLIYPMAPFLPSGHELILLHHGRTLEYSTT